MTSLLVGILSICFIVVQFMIYFFIENYKEVGIVMFLSDIMQILIMLFIVSIIGYILVVMKERFYLSENVIVLGKKSVTQELIDETDMKFFSIGGINIKSGDEIRIILSNNNKVDGIVIGAKAIEKEILLITHKDEIKSFSIEKIKKVKLLSKYGSFF